MKSNPKVQNNFANESGSEGRPNILQLIKSVPEITTRPQSLENKQGGYIKMYRSLINHWLWKEKKFSKFQAFIYLLFEAKYKDDTEPFGYSHIQLKRGQLLTSQDKLAKAFGWNRQSVRTFLNSLEKDKILTSKSTNSYTVVTLCQYDLYQSEVYVTNQRKTSRQPTSNQLPSTVKKEKKEKKEFIPPSWEEVKSFFVENRYPEDLAERAFNYYAIADWHDGNGKPVRNWKQKFSSVWFKTENKMSTLPTGNPESKTLSAREAKDAKILNQVYE